MDDVFLFSYHSLLTPEMVMSESSNRSVCESKPSGTNNHATLKITLMTFLLHYDAHLELSMTGSLDICINSQLNGCTCSTVASEHIFTHTNKVLTCVRHVLYHHTSFQFAKKRINKHH